MTRFYPNSAHSAENSTPFTYSSLIIPLKISRDELMFSVLCAVDCSYFAFAEIFDLRIFVLTHDLGLTLPWVSPFSERSWYSLSSLSIL